MTKIELIRFEAELFELKGQAILRLSKVASAKLPSRGQAAVHGTVNGHDLQTVLEPDGHFGHWMRVDSALQMAVGMASGDTPRLKLEVTQDRPEPDVPEDVAKVLSAAPQTVKDKWNDITPMARLEWIRWVNETRNRDTRALRIEKTISKLYGKHRRACCSNLAACTDPELSTSGKLLFSAKKES